MDNKKNPSDVHLDTQNNPQAEASVKAERALGGNEVPGIQTGGHAKDGTPDTRGIMEKAADAITGDKIDDKTGKRID